MTTTALNTPVIHDNKERMRVLLPLLVAGFVMLLNETLLNVAFASFMEEFGVDASTVQWLSTGYVLVIGILIPVTAFLMQSIQTRYLFLIALSTFLICSIVCSFAHSFGILLFFRMVQGVGTGINLPLMTSIALAISPPEKRGATMGACTFVILIAPAIGPTLSGIILNFFSWHALFYLLLPFVILSMYFGARYLPTVFEITKPKVDILSIILSTLGFGGIIFSVSNISSTSLFHGMVWPTLVLGLIALICFFIRQLRLPQPLLHVSVLKKRQFLLGVILVMCTMMTIFAVNIILPIYYQSALHFSSFKSGLMMMPAGIISGFVTLLAGYLYDRGGIKWLVRLGFLFILCGLLLISRVGLEASVLHMIVMQCIVFVGTPLIMQPVQTNALNYLSRYEEPHGIAIIKSFLQVGAASGTSLYVSLMAIGENRYLSKLASAPSELDSLNAMSSGMHFAFSVAVGIIAVAFIASFFAKSTRRVE